MMNPYLSRLVLLPICSAAAIPHALAAGPPPPPPQAYLLEAKILSLPATPEWAQALSGPKTAVADELVERAQSADGAQILSSPAVLARTGQEAEMHIQSELQYLHREDNGTFTMQTVDPDDAPGIHLHATMNPAGDGNIQLDIRLRVQVLAGRESLPGVDLDVGRPILESRVQFDSRLVLAPGHWISLGGSRLEDVANASEDLLAVLVRVGLPPHGQDPD